ncbi:MAG TPA: response regulator transcription factor [Tepidiformaceae bacterium]|nr:response regulator transcription factor [Tepidiformaceae bacterium]
MVIRVVVADDHELVRIGILQYLSNHADVEVLETVADGAAVIDAALAHQPDVVVMDLAMPGLDGVEATRRMGQVSPATNVIVLTSFSDRDRILKAIDAGAVGYLLKDCEPADLLEGIRAAARGHSPLSPRAAEALVAELRSAESKPPPLTVRELEVLHLIVQGYANKQIALELGISEKTVKAHLTSIFQAIGAADRTQAALWAERNSIFATEEPAGPA